MINYVYIVNMENEPCRGIRDGMKAEKKTVILSVRVDAAVGEAIQAFAEEEDRTVSKYLERLVRKHVAEKQGGDGVKPKRSAK